MAKVNFTLTKTRIHNKRSGWFCDGEYARCDLARSAVELSIIADMLNTLDWIDNAAEHEGSLYIKTDYKMPWLVQERAFHQALAIARKHVDELFALLKKGDFPEAEIPEYHEGYESSMRPTVSINEKKDNGSLCSRGTYVMPERCYSPGFTIHKHEDGILRGYFLSGNRYDNTSTRIATKILTIFRPDIVVKATEPHEGAEILPATDDLELRNLATACIRGADAIIARYKHEMKEFEWEGKPSVFTAEDNDARDLLLEDIRGGMVIERTRNKHDSYSELHEDITYTGNGEELPAYIVQRLINADILHIEGWPYSMQKVDEPLKPLTLYPRVNPAVFAGRSRVVNFKAFESYCSNRRYDAYSECSHSKSRSEYCSPGSCPILTQVYREDIGRYAYNYDEDPAFGDDYEADPLMRADHPNTERSYAWKAAGEYAVTAILNQVLSSHFKMGISKHLFGYEHRKSIREAEAQGLLSVEEMPGLGVVAGVTEKLLKIVEERREAIARHEAEREAANREAEQSDHVTQEA